MIHRACYGSLERFLGIVIENYAGAFPLWLAPTQVIVLPISEKYQAYANQVVEKLEQKGLRTEVNLRDDRIGYKVREASLQKIPYVLIVGEKEIENQTINARSRDRGDLSEMSLDHSLNHSNHGQNNSPPELGEEFGVSNQAQSRDHHRTFLSSSLPCFFRSEGISL